MICNPELAACNLTDQGLLAAVSLNQKLNTVAIIAVAVVAKIPTYVDSGILGNLLRLENFLLLLLENVIAISMVTLISVIFFLIM